MSHAVIDALLGAVGGGDVGTHFPAGDERWRDADSMDLLRRTVALLEGRNYQVVNVDVTVVCETPRIGPHAGAMRDRLGEVLGIGPDFVSVKGKTNEGMGWIGSGEGLAVPRGCARGYDPRAVCARRRRRAAALRNHVVPGDGAGMKRGEEAFPARAVRRFPSVREGPFGAHGDRLPAGSASAGGVPRGSGDPHPGFDGSERPPRVHLPPQGSRSGSDVDPPCPVVAPNLLGFPARGGAGRGGPDRSARDAAHLAQTS